MTVTHGPVVIRRRLGWALKQLRVRHQKQLADIARLLEMSPSKLSRIETGQVEPKYRDVRDLLEIYEAPVESREQLLAWAMDAKSPGWWQPFNSTVAVADLDMFISLESESASELMFSTPVTGLLQTEAYARAILSDAFPSASAAELDKLVAIRIGRQAVVAPDRGDAPPLRLHAVIDESAIRRGRDRDVLREQVRYLLERSEQPNIDLQVLPFAAGYTRATSTFAIFEPREATSDWTVVNVESTGHDAYFDTPAEVASYRSIWTDVLGGALSTDASRDFLRAVLAE
ncbi:helix-turn-helix domain-containing protein [Pseudonocardia spirodelae]|uniref:Helix-turn-helix transcriptional regulator n=1 Tax=Pseudonocardia spirodelae TaxID=3133431 RepID=A0ABU8T4J9_9PSEU